MIIIYRLKNIEGNIRAVKWDEWTNGKLIGHSQIKISEKELLHKFNKGYWRTGAV